ncbi:DUF4129 domain-containing protein [Cellulomonas sp. KH9]|uniref:DUF4129 domain-containing protein n=1 Tax=Cellulomonas sp. KH9 TaxID=1855324 RepID=UPI0008F35390|nr:DUF4129 domain-containing protein [Cellulomonas sp. KH9]SFJ61141.1 protein of unknown function [Cellulomonas sp. KH9]
MPTRSTAAVTALSALLVVLAVLAAAVGGPLSLAGRGGEVPVPTDTPSVEVVTASPAPRPPDLDDVTTTFEWVDGIVRALQVLAALAGVVVLVLVVRYLARGWRLDRPAGDEDDAPAGDETDDELSDTAVAALREGVRAASRALEDDVPPGDAVIGAWVAVETAAARTGVVRDPAETAGELTVRVLGATRADPTATRALLRLYLSARYGTHGVDADDVRRARDLLTVVGQGLVPREDGAGEDDAGREDATDREAAP